MHTRYSSTFHEHDRGLKRESRQLETSEWMPREPCWDQQYINLAKVLSVVVDQILYHLNLVNAIPYIQPKDGKTLKCRSHDK